MKYFPIPDHPRYEITRNGIIRNRSNKRIKSQYVGSTGYYMVSFSYNNHSNPKRVHRLLAAAFLENPNSLPCINHKNGDKLDNCLLNLEWCTHAQNMKHAFDTGLANNTGTNNGQSKLTDSKVKKIKSLLRLGKTQQSIADKYGVSRSCILGINVGRLWSHVKI